MSLTPGARIGPYEVATRIGVGVMGEVYRATDTKLGRHVAIKVLPTSVAQDGDRLARFDREARTLAALNHPNIAAIYGLEDVDGAKALVMELVEGEDLSQRLARGAIPIGEALPMAKQIAEALEAAHEQGIIHRDLKPANIKVRPDGTVKVLDFGLAKAMEPSGAMASNSMSPTITTPAMTQAGMLLGTAAYMSPEQASGKLTDSRSDLWAFGVVLMEMLTGRRVFEGETVSHVLASVLKDVPDLAALPGATPEPVRRLLRRCLEKDRRLRLDSAVAARLEIADALANPASHAPIGRGGWSPALVMAVAVAMLVIAGGALWAWRPRAPLPAQSPVHVELALPPLERLDQGGLNLAVSPDGAQVAYVATRDGVSQLFVRPLAAAAAAAIPGTNGAFSPFFSPDGQWLGFFAEGKMKKVPVRGGAPQILCDAGLSGGASWGPDDKIIFAPSAQTGTAGLWVVPAAGGQPTVLTTPDPANGEYSHRYPQLIAGGTAVVFTALGGFGWDESRIELLRLDTKERRTLVRGGHTGRVVASGHLVYSRARTLLAVPFDESSLQVTSNTPTTIAEGVAENTGAFGATFATSPAGVLAYLPSAGTRALEQQIAWVDRYGAVTPLPAPTRNYGNAALSPDSQQIAATITGGTDDLWIYDVSKGSMSQLPAAKGSRLDPVWTPDGRRVVYRSNRDGIWNLYWTAADGTGSEERLDRSDIGTAPYSWSPDGRVLAYTRSAPKTGTDIWTLTPGASGGARVFLQTPSIETQPMFSPDGHWLAYTSDESGAEQVYVQPYPGPGRRWQISTDGGGVPQWNPNGRELFYRSGGRTMVVDVATSSASFTAGRPRILYDGPGGTVSRDGQRFLVLQSVAPEQPPTHVRLVLNWYEELRRLVPSK